MHSRSAIILLIAAAAMVFVSGCKKREMAWIEPPTLQIHIASEVNDGGPAIIAPNTLKGKDAPKILGGTPIKQPKLVESLMGNNAEADFLNRLSLWEKEREMMPDTVIVPKPKPQPNKSVGTGGDMISWEPVRVLEYPDSTEIVNLNIRVLLLERRLLSAAPVNEAAIEAELAEARQSLKEAQREYGGLVVEKTEPATPTTVGNTPVQRPNTVIKVAEYDDSAIRKLLKSMNESSVKRAGIVTSYPDLNGYSDYREMEKRSLSSVGSILNKLSEKRSSGLL